MSKNLIVFALCMQLITIPLHVEASVVLSSVDSGVKIDWSFFVEASGRTEVSLTAVNITRSEIAFEIPKTYEDLRIIPSLNYTIKPFVGYSFDKLSIHCDNVGQVNLSYVWPDGAIQYSGSFYFAGQEKPRARNDNNKVTIKLPKNCSVLWIEGYNEFTGNITDELHFEINAKEPIPSFKYLFPDLPQPEIATRTDEHLTLHYHPIMEGKPWIDETVEVIEEQWSWLKNVLNGTLDHVKVSFVPYGYNDFGIKKDGFCYYNSRNIEIVATNQFGIGLNGHDTALVLHELTHALTPLFEALPAFYSEAIAQDFSYDALRRTDLNASADSCEETQFDNAYEYGIQQGLFDYIWFWNWNNTIYDNKNITDACYGTVSFIGDYITHHWGHMFYQELNGVFNKTEIDSLPENRKLAKFVEYMSEISRANMNEILNSLPDLVTSWFEAYNLRKEFIDYEIKNSGPFTEAAQPTIDQMVLSATEKYDDRNYEAAIQEFEEIKEYVETLQTRDKMLYDIIIFAIIIGLVILAYYVLKNRARQEF